MGQEVINLNTVFSGFDSGTDLQPKNARTNNQGVKINDIAGFVQIQAAAPATTTGLKGDMVYALADHRIYVCENSFGTLEVSTILAGTPSSVASATAGTYTGVALTGGTGTGAKAIIIMADPTTVTSITINVEGKGYKTGDTLVIAAQTVGASSTSFTIPLVAADTASIWYKTAALTV
jgi:hypothetical protein